MSYVVKHNLVSRPLEVTLEAHADGAILQCVAEGTFQLVFPGALRTEAVAGYTVSFLSFPTGDADHPRRETVARTLPLTVEIRTPDGKLFEGTNVTLSDLARFRDPGGAARGLWSYRLHGRSEPHLPDEDRVQLRLGAGSLSITVEEAVPSQSAPPLVDERVGARAERRFRFDLFRVGQFVARSRSAHWPLVSGARRMRLLDPDGQVVAVGEDGHLSFPVALRTLARSRDAAGKPRLWTLEVSPSTGPFAAASDIWATVVATTRIGIGTLQRRIDALLGIDGENIEKFGTHHAQTSEMLARLRIRDEVTAGTIDLLHLIDKVIEAEVDKQDPGVDVSDVLAGVPYVIAHRKRDLGFRLLASLDGLKISTIRIQVGLGEHLVPAMPALKIEVGVVGRINIKAGGLTVATATVRDGRIRCEAGLTLDAEGELIAASWVEPDRLDLNIHWTTLVTLGIISFGVLGLAGAAAVEAIENYFAQDLIPDAFNGFMRKVMPQAREAVDLFLGDHFTLRSIRFDGEDVLIDYLAPIEPDPRPSEGYRGIVGRSFDQLGPNAFRFRPPSLGDTWAHANLSSKIDHIVIVMMENRSYDHILGYRSLASLDQSDGWTAEMIEFLARQTFIPPQEGENRFELSDEQIARLEGAAFTVRALREADIQPNVKGFKTKFPNKPPIYFRFVEQQLSKRLEVPGRAINSPNGFLGSFIGRVGSADKVRVQDVLGYYDAGDLPFYGFLADYYGFSDRYHCSHPGPTLPNRMFALSGALQRDRAGQPILDNNTGESLRLSRATTIFDLLSRFGVGWRVYESFPSVSMLRMFARYATDDVQIVDLSRFAADAAAGKLPSVTVVEPAMHHFPPTDDHPVADMYNGQVFLKHVYQALRANRAHWAGTLLIISYDEHGGFYDHAVPPLAEVRTQPSILAHPERRGSGRPGRVAPPLEVLEQLLLLAQREGVDVEPPPPTFTAYGLRVPAFVVSPWVPRGRGPAILLDHCSILKTILARFCAQTRPFLSDRVNASHSFESFLSEPVPRLDVPDPPALPPLDVQLATSARRIETKALFRRDLRAGDVDWHDLMGTLGRLMGRP